jgi:hypothetical protein
MSMQSTGASGYVVKASAFTNLLPEPLREKYTQAIADGDAELVNEILGENAPEQFPFFESSFKLNEEDNAENITKGEVYICFQEDDLYFMRPKPELDFLMAHGIKPEFERWCVWG